MEKITVRQFRAKLSQYLIRIKSGEVLQVGDVKLSVYTEKDTKSAKVEDLSVHETSLAQEQAVSEACTQQAWTCDKCSKESDKCYDTVEDGIDRVVCFSCAKRAMPPQLFLKFLKLNKLKVE